MVVESAADTAAVQLALVVPVAMASAAGAVVLVRADLAAADMVRQSLLARKRLPKDQKQVLEMVAADRLAARELAASAVVVAVVARKQPDLEQLAAVVAAATAERVLHC